MEILEECERRVWNKDVKCKECKSKLRIYETDL